LDSDGWAIKGLDPGPELGLRPIPRVIPCLLLEDEGFVKTIRFKDPTYLGDAINIINLFNRFEVDEIVLLDIRATQRRQPPPFELIERLASECWVPLAYGGGIRNFDDVRTVLRIGVEKVVIGTAAADHPEIIADAAASFGRQAVVVSVDTRERSGGRYEVFVESGTRSLKTDPVTYARRVEGLGAGEIFLNTIHRDGVMEGFDLGLIESVTRAVKIPVIACGGAGTRADIPLPVKRAGAAAVAAGSLFVYRGRERGVLVNFPERAQLESLFD
jgi:imidazole glycerol-phosphate synthase subunit HisF